MGSKNWPLSNQILFSILRRFCFSSGADEKMVRVFQAPKNFLRNFGRLCDGNVDEDLKKMVRIYWMSVCILQRTKTEEELKLKLSKTVLSMVLFVWLFLDCSLWFCLFGFSWVALGSSVCLASLGFCLTINILCRLCHEKLKIGQYCQLTKISQ